MKYLSLLLCGFIINTTQANTLDDLLTQALDNKIANKVLKTSSTEEFRCTPYYSLIKIKRDLRVPQKNLILLGNKTFHSLPQKLKDQVRRSKMTLAFYTKRVYGKGLFKKWKLEDSFPGENIQEEFKRVDDNHKIIFKRSQQFSIQNDLGEPSLSNVIQIKHGETFLKKPNIVKGQFETEYIMVRALGRGTALMISPNTDSFSLCINDRIRKLRVSDKILEEGIEALLKMFLQSEQDIFNPTVEVPNKKKLFSFERAQTILEKFSEYSYEDQEKLIEDSLKYSTLAAAAGLGIGALYRYGAKTRTLFSTGIFSQFMLLVIPANGQADHLYDEHKSYCFHPDGLNHCLRDKELFHFHNDNEGYLSYEFLESLENNLGTSD